MADVLIRGMELPETCGFCKLCLDDSRICNGYCMLFHCRVNMMERDKDCPLVPLPEGHGRLIDADALDRAFTDLRFNSDGTLNHWGDRPGWCMHGYEVEKLIADAPTIVPAEGGRTDNEHV